MRRPSFEPAPKMAERIYWQAIPDGIIGHLACEGLIYSGLWKMSFREAGRLIHHRKFPLPINTPFHLPGRIKNVQTDEGGVYPLYRIERSGSAEHQPFTRPSEAELKEVAARKFFSSNLVVSGLARNVATPWFAERA